MTPDYIEWVELSDHAEAKMQKLGLSESFVIGRIKNGNGIAYRDTQKQDAYNLYLPDQDLIIAFHVDLSRSGSKTAVVSTVFPTDSPWTRFKGDRFVKYER